MKRSPYWDEVRAETIQKVMSDVLEARFPGAVSPQLAQRIQAEKDLAKLDRWVKLVSTAASPQAFEASIAEN